jgi:hypothetical protein
MVSICVTIIEHNCPQGEEVSAIRISHSFPPSEANGDSLTRHPERSEGLIL